MSDLSQKTVKELRSILREYKKIHCKPYSKLKKALYIDSSIEDYEEDLKKDKPIEHKTLYYRGLEADKKLKKIRSPKSKTILRPGSPDVKW